MTPFNLRRPCRDCPFRLDRPGYLTRPRAAEIVAALGRGEHFHCHKTIDYGAAEDSEPVTDPATAQLCAGSILMLEKSGRRLPAIAQIGVRLGCYDPATLRGGDAVHSDAEAFIKAQQKADHFYEFRLEINMPWAYK